MAVTGEMLARQKLLKARGWAVISVPFFRWSGLTDAQRTDWLFPVGPPPRYHSASGSYCCSRCIPLSNKAKGVVSSATICQLSVVWCAGAQITVICSLADVAADLQELAHARTMQAQRRMWIAGNAPIPPPRPPPGDPPPQISQAPPPYAPPALAPPVVSVLHGWTHQNAYCAQPLPPAQYQPPVPAPNAAIQCEAVFQTPGVMPTQPRNIAPAPASAYTMVWTTLPPLPITLF